MIRSVVGLFVGIAVSLALSTVTLAMLWGRPTPRGSVVLSLTIASLCVALGGLIAGVIGEKRTLLLGGLVGLAIGAFVSLWAGAFPLKRLLFQTDVLRVWVVPLTTIAGLLGGWFAGRLIAPGGLLAGDQ